METEQNKCIPFLDILATKNSKLSTSVYRKKTFTGLGSSFYSFTPFKYKLATIKALTPGLQNLL